MEDTEGCRDETSSVGQQEASMNLTMAGPTVIRIRFSSTDHGFTNEQSIPE